ncbi:alginate O-acetyltransferase AlgX-related protein [Brevifollis gellanilyticus]|uniref:AlgX/AlgJ SGNH hydrolase-like domain-containing protein n=1 Tax=Brevifollis gellanilyticus TaxID=748831 RepID=A0A512MEJ3_9BACT|nr:hypothetical protein [Brevifollis gellanilyticus]GEP45160.1 hypothetical protein BGE01nite_44510 [Brevifollis gellanilyticus]
MIYAKPLIPPLVVLFLVAVATLKRSQTLPKPQRSTALARLGFGLAKICLLVLPLEWLVHLFQLGEPQALSAKAFWLAALAQTCQLQLLITGVVDVVASFMELRGHAVEGLYLTPARAGSFGGYWSQLVPGLINGPVTKASQALPVLMLIAGLGVLWHGNFPSSSVWFVLQFLFLMAETKRQKPLFAPLPHPIQVILTLLLLVLSNSLLLVPNLEAALTSWVTMFSDIKPTLYSLLLDKRLTSNLLQTVMLFAILTCVALPRLDWLLRQRTVIWRLIGLLLIIPSLLMLVRENARTPDFIRQAAQWPVTWFFGEGNSRIHVGYDGWLYPRHELDRRTLARRHPGLTDSLIKLATDLKAQNVPVMLVSVPAKMAMYPENVLRAEYAAPAQPADYKAIVEKLTAAGVDVVDPAQALWQRLLRAESHYTADSHWTFETMKTVAGAVAKHIREKHAALYVSETPLINASILERQEPGDLAKALLTLNSEGLFGAEHAQLVSIRGLENDPKSPILVIGHDSLRVFEAASESFGNAEGKNQQAGFTTQLAALLGRPLDERTGPDILALASDVTHKKLIVLVVPADEL